MFAALHVLLLLQLTSSKSIPEEVAPVNGEESKEIDTGHGRLQIHKVQNWHPSSLALPDALDSQLALRV